MKSMLIALMMMVGTSQAMATVVLGPGETRYVSGDYVTCDPSFRPPPPAAPLPPPKQVYYVNINPNVSCLLSIPVTDGRDVSRRAASCDYNNIERRELQRADCSLISTRVDHQLADEVIRKANTVIHEHQKDTVRDASSYKQYRCER